MHVCGITVTNSGTDMHSEGRGEREEGEGEQHWIAAAVNLSLTTVDVRLTSATKSRRVKTLRFLLVAVAYAITYNEASNTARSEAPSGAQFFFCLTAI